ncbi:MAG: metallophosphoesterase, partial [Kiritimatiellia bacterium]
VAVVNDTHENKETLAKLPGRIDAAAPHLLVWNGDTCNDFDAKDDPAAILLTPGAAADNASDGGWASTRPLWFVAGNHDVRGERAREVMDILAPGPRPGLPWNFAFRDGPLALIGLDTGEDKPDAHPVFAGTAAYEPYRERQAVWLQEALARPEIAAAPFKVLFCHIPLRGEKGDNPGTSTDGFAGYCGFGAALWLPLLREAGVRMIVSGHTHDWRIDDPTDEQPFFQVVGGGPQPARATLTVIDVTTDRLSVRIEDLTGKTLIAREIASA